MAVSIGELQVETQQPQAAPTTAAPSARSNGELDLRCAMESLRERQLRLEAD